MILMLWFYLIDRTQKKRYSMAILESYILGLIWFAKKI